MMYFEFLARVIYSDTSYHEPFNYDFYRNLFINIKVLYYLGCERCIPAAKSSQNIFYQSSDL